MGARHDWRSFGKRGALVRMRVLSSKRRREIAENAAKARWKRTTKAERSEFQRRRVLARWEARKATGR